MQLLECVPNFSEGRNQEVIDLISDAIKSVEGVRLLDIDSSYAANRTVFTFIGEPEFVVEAAFRSIAVAYEQIDMNSHSGEHPRIGACDVCPLIPVANMTIDEAVDWSKKLAQSIGEELFLPVYLYEHSATNPERVNLSHIRKGEYEQLPEKILNPNWIPDFGPYDFNSKFGAVVVGARDFLIAFNINLDTKDVIIARDIASIIRTSGKKTKSNQIAEEGKFKSLKAIGWYVDDFACSQVSINFTDFNITGLYEVFIAVQQLAEIKNIDILGSELVGMMPKKALMDASIMFLNKNEIDYSSFSEIEILAYGSKKLGLNSVKEFDIKTKIIEYRI